MREKKGQNIQNKKLNTKIQNLNRTGKQGLTHWQSSGYLTVTLILSFGLGIAICA